MKTVADKTNIECCGCGACEAVCPTGAIQMELDGDGFYYPRVDEECCIACGKCVRMCVFFPNIDKNGREEKC